MDNDFLDMGDMTPEEIQNLQGKPITEPNADTDSQETQQNTETISNGEEQGNAALDANGSPLSVTSIAQAFKGSAFQNLTDEEINQIDTPDKFGEAVQLAIKRGTDTLTQKVNDALSYEMEVPKVQKFAKVIKWIDGIQDTQLNDEGDTGTQLRKQLITLGFKLDNISDENAELLTKNSFEAGNDIADAKQARDTISKKYKEALDAAIAQAKVEDENKTKELNKFTEDVKNSIMSKDDAFLKSLNVSDVTRADILKNLSEVVYTDDNGKSYTALQKYMKDSPIDFNKYVGTIYTLTNGFKDFSKLFLGKANQIVDKKMSELDKAFQNITKHTGSSINHAASTTKQVPVNFDFDKDFDIVI